MISSFSASRPAVIAAHRVRIGLQYGNDAGFDVRLDFHTRLLLFELDDRAMTMGVAQSASRPTTIVSHKVRREGMAELIMAARIFSGRRRMGSVSHRRFAAG
jgi:hypothetical protein